MDVFLLSGYKYEYAGNRETRKGNRARNQGAVIRHPKGVQRLSQDTEARSLDERRVAEPGS